MICMFKMACAFAFGYFIPFDFNGFMAGVCFVAWVIADTVETNELMDRLFYGRTS